MNEIVNVFLLAGNKLMPEMHLKQLGFTYSACGKFIKNKERKQKFKETRDSRFIKMSLLKVAFDMILLIEILKIQQEEQLQIKF